MSQQSDYIGDELTLFQHAKNWKAYYSSFFRKYLKGRVLEVGAGIGGTTMSLCDGSQDEWLCLEPDASLTENIEKLIAEKKLPACCKAKTGFITDVPASEKYDAILYIDVIEHIEDDKAELKRAVNYLKPGGVVIIIVPAHQFLYSPFDKAIGHFRRYSLKRTREAIPAELKIIKSSYLDSVGLAASTANKLLLKQSYPTLKQVMFWDKVMVPLSRIADKLLLHSVGKSVLLIAQKP
jgi:SAM-dependent methyltransferase